MTTAGLSLTAQYKVAYTVEIYLQNLEQNGYEKDTETVTGYAYVGTSVTPEQTVTGFKQTTNSNAVETLTMSETASNNVLKLYFNRNTYKVIYNSNYPDGADSETYTVEVVYGKEAEIASNYFTAEGYCLLGWATYPSGSVKYASNYLTSALYTKDGNKTEGVDKVSPDSNVYLYAV
jgi:hypothetical protein